MLSPNTAARAALASGMIAPDGSCRNPDSPAITSSLGDTPRVMWAEGRHLVAGQVSAGCGQVAERIGSDGGPQQRRQI